MGESGGEMAYKPFRGRGGISRRGIVVVVSTKGVQATEY